MRDNVLVFGMENGKVDEVDLVAAHEEPDDEKDEGRDETDEHKQVCLECRQRLGEGLRVFFFFFFKTNERTWAGWDE